MNEYRSLHLQRNLAEVLASAEAEPTLLLNRGQPRLVMLSVNEFRRLKGLAGEAVPEAALPRRSIVVRGKIEDPLGYDTSDLYACAREMADAALSGRNTEAVNMEIDRVRARFSRSQG